MRWAITRLLLWLVAPDSSIYIAPESLFEKLRRGTYKVHIPPPVVLSIS